jgi:ribosomal subunit interface protein
VEIVVRSRHTDLPERFRKHAQSKLSRLERLNGRLIRIDVEICEEHNPRQSDIRERVELTALGRGPLVRAEAAAQDPYAALDIAAAKLEERLRRAADRRHSRGSRVHGAASVERGAVAGETAAPAEGSEIDGASADTSGDTGPMIVREKTHAAAPMSLDDALHQMELVGHDFYLFVDVASGLPSVVYRRRGYDYGVIHLATADTVSANGSHDLTGAGDIVLPRR